MHLAVPELVFNLLFFGKHALVLFFSSGLLLCLVPNKNLLVPGLLQKSIQGFCKTGPFQGFPENCHYYIEAV
jgi:hypothetical protein